MFRTARSFLRPGWSMRERNQQWLVKRIRSPPWDGPSNEMKHLVHSYKDLRKME